MGYLAWMVFKSRNGSDLGFGAMLVWGEYTGTYTSTRRERRRE
jgi:hypothetical protein